MRSLLLLLLVAAAGSCHAGFISILSQVQDLETVQSVCKAVDLLNEEGLGIFKNTCVALRLSSVTMVKLRYDGAHSAAYFLAAKVHGSAADETS